MNLIIGGIIGCLIGISIVFVGYLMSDEIKEFIDNYY